MLSVDLCRRVLGNAELTDEEIEQIRTAMYSLGNLMIEQYLTSFDETKKDLGEHGHEGN